MKIPSPKYLKKRAANRLAYAKEPEKIMLVYAGITLLSSLLVTAVRYYLSTQISHAGGLQNLNTRSMLSTADTILPILQSLMLMCLELGFAGAMLRIARRQYASPMSLKAGLERFWVLLRSKLLIGLLYAASLLAALYFSVMIFQLSPLSNQMNAVLAPLVEQYGYSTEAILNAEGTADALLSAMTPVLFIYIVMALVLFLPVFYRYRFVDYILIERPQFGASAAMHTSRMLMRGNFLPMLKLDLSFWWFYGLEILASCLAYADLILGMFGITFPLPENVIFFGTFLLYLLAEFAILYFLKMKVSVTYAAAYDSLCPQEKPQDGVVLGNIFQQ